MSGTTFSTYPVQSQPATRAAPQTGTTYAASVEQSYLSAQAQYAAPPPPATTSYGQGPGLTTLAVGEEDGGASMGGAGAMPQTGSMSAPAMDSGFQVTTLAIGEEDGGGGYGTMSPIRDDHAIIGGHVDTGSGGAVGSQEGYGEMQPIYSPGEAEYPAFAKTSETSDLLNFHPVARLPKAALPQSMPVAAAPPVSVPAPVTAQPVYASPTPVGAMTQDVPLTGSYESVGSYEEYVGGGASAPAITGQYIETPPAYEPAMAAPEQPAMETTPSAPVYESYQPASEQGSYYESMRAAQPEPASVYEPVAAPYEPAPAPMAPVQAVPAPMAPTQVAPPAALAPAPTYDATVAVAPDPAPSISYAPVSSAEPRAKPSLFEKDAPLDHTSSVQPADPADGNPGYVAPAPAPGATDPAYVEVSIDDYLVEASGAQDAAIAAPAMPDAPGTEPAASAPAMSAPVAPTTPPMPAPAAVTPPAAAPLEYAPSMPAPAATAPYAAPTIAPPTADVPPSDTPSLGGSYVVIDTSPPVSLTGPSSGAGSAGAQASDAASDTGAAETPDQDLRIMTLSIGEEAGVP